MKYKCLSLDCGKQFMYTAKKIVSTVKNTALTNEETFTDVTVETNVCPYCDSLNFDESPAEAPVNPEIIALIDSPLADVNARLAEGYRVMPDKIYAKSAVLVKYRIPETKTIPAAEATQ